VVTKLFHAFTLYGSLKVYIWSLLSSIAFFFLYWGAKHPYNTGDTTMTALSLAVVLVGAILFIAFYAIGNRQLALAFARAEFHSEEATFMDAVSQGKKYFLSVAMLFLSVGILTLFIVPAFGSLAGGFFLVSIAGHDFNILMLFLNFFFVYAWFFLGTAEIELADLKFKDTIPETIGFIFDNFLKMIGYAFMLFIVLMIFNFIVVSLLPLSRVVALPILVLLFAYVLAFVNSVTVSFVGENLDTGEREPEEEE
jgi:hypothetical protein